MKRDRLVVLTVILVILLALTGCTGKADNDDNDNDDVDYSTQYAYEGNKAVLNLRIEYGTGEEWKVIYATDNITPGKPEYHGSGTETASSGGSGVAHMEFTFGDGTSACVVLKRISTQDSGDDSALEYAYFTLTGANGSITGMEFKDVEISSFCGVTCDSDDAYMGMLIPNSWEYKIVNEKYDHYLLVIPVGEMGYMQISYLPVLGLGGMGLKQNYEYINGYEYAFGSYDDWATVSFIYGENKIYYVTEDSYGWYSDYFPVLVMVMDSAYCYEK